MNILFMSLSNYSSINEKGIYTDLLREFVKRDNNVYIISAAERFAGEAVIYETNCKIVKIATGKIAQTNIIRKGINTLLLEKRFIKGIKKYLNDVKFDLILYPTPPITLAGVVEYVKKRDNARTYLMLKDIFPQNAVDIGMMSKEGIKGILYRFFRKKEKKLYGISDFIGAMSEANVNYLLKHNTEIDPKKVGVCPNCMDVSEIVLSESERTEIRNRYKLPADKIVFVYGGNLGKPQDIPFIIECIKQCEKIKEAFFFVVGNGTEYSVMNKFVEDYKPTNLLLMSGIPKEDYDYMIAACDVGMIFLDKRFTIPNFPSRLLSYMQAKLPVLACTDKNTDIGTIAEAGHFGKWCESSDPSAVMQKVAEFCNTPLKEMGEKGYRYLLDNYSAEVVYKRIEGDLSGKV